MNGIVINVDPVIFHLGGFELRWYSVAIMVAVVAAVAVAIREGKRRGIRAAEFYNLAPWVLLGGLVGARLFHVVDRWSYYAANPSAIFMVQQGGLAIWGGLAGGGLAAAVYARRRHLSFGLLADALVPGLLVAQMVGRLGCIVNGDAYGGYTSLPWGFIYMHPGAMIPAELAGVPTHPYPVYEILWNGIALFALLRLRPHLKRNGLLFLACAMFYAAGRFVLTFVGQETEFLWGMQQAQVLAVLVLAVAAGAFAGLLLGPRAGPGRAVTASNAAGPGNGP